MPLVDFKSRLHLAFKWLLIIVLFVLGSTLGRNKDKLLCTLETAINDDLIRYNMGFKVNTTVGNQSICKATRTNQTEINRVIAHDYFIGDLYNILLVNILQYNLNGSNTDGSFTVDDSNSFFSPYKILPIAQENKYLGIFSYFIMELYVVCTH